MTRISALRTPRSARALASLLVLGALGCGGGDPLEGLPNVVIIVLDTVRADHLSAYGYHRPTTPHIDELCESAVRYTHCRATGPWTLPSHASIFTGRFAFQHGARTEKFPDGQLRELPLSLEHETLAEALGEVGYRTGAFVANAAYLREEFQLDQGFDRYVVEREPGLEKNNTAFEWLSEEEGPFFLFLNYMDAHRPYNTRPLLDERADEFVSAGVVHTSALLDELYKQVMEEGLEPSPEIVGELIARYDTGLANADLAVGEVIEQLKSQGVWENTLLIVTSDHGEFFGEHGLVEHSKDVYEEVMHIPLVCKLPGSGSGRVDDGLISLADVPALVAEALPEELGRELAERFPRSSRPDLSIAEISYSRGKDLTASYGQRFQRERRVVYSGRYKLIHSSDGQNELYNLEVDPDELNNLFEKRPKVVQGLMMQLTKYVKQNPPTLKRAGPVILDKEALRALHELGYTGEEDEDTQDEGAEPR